MNAAAKVINQSNFFHGEWANMRFSMPMFFQIGLLFTILITALSVVYTTNMHRLAFSELERAEDQAHQLELQWGQLLLEKASYVTPSRVEKEATAKLEMVLPNEKNTYILRLK